MCLAIATYENRVASLFESSDKLVLLHSPSYDFKHSKSIIVNNKAATELKNMLKSNNIKILICGAIRGYILQQIEAQNIKVIPWITGDIKNVVEAFLSDDLYSPSFLMPGCRNRGHQNRRRFRRG